mmetsp:Transcript_43278/g.122613  ORF Transcript_43278/g.122613 Transcript_43278/m.122613 type:complete len:258 (+) Transcript_43278:3148-3921(+)
MVAGGGGRHSAPLHRCLGRLGQQGIQTAATDTTVEDLLCCAMHPVSLLEVGEDLVRGKRRHRRNGGLPPSRTPHPSAAPRGVYDVAIRWGVVLECVLPTRRTRSADGQFEGGLVIDDPHLIAVAEQLEPAAVAELHMTANHHQLRHYWSNRRLVGLVGLEVVSSGFDGQVAVAAVLCHLHHAVDLGPRVALLHDAQRPPLVLLTQPHELDHTSEALVVDGLEQLLGHIAARLRTIRQTTSSTVVQPGMLAASRGRRA